MAMTMLAMAETLRQLQPPKVKMAIKCAKASNFSNSFEVVFPFFFFINDWLHFVFPKS